MEPAYHIPLDADSLRLIGEICAIQGQIEWTMQNSARELLRVDAPTAQRIMGSTSIATNAEIWINLVRKRQRRKIALAHAEQAYADIRALAEGRNDFVHAVYFVRASPKAEKIFMYIAAPERVGLKPPRTAVAVRVRNRKESPVAKLTEVRDIAASISVRVAHAHWETVIRPRVREPSPWLDRLDELPPLPTPKKEAQRAKGRAARRPASRG